MTAKNDATAPAPSLTRAVGQGERAQGLVEEVAQDLESVNTVLKDELSVQDSRPGVEQALKKSEGAEDKVQQATFELSVMNRALKKEVRERHALEQQLEAVTEQGKVAEHASLHDPLTGLPNRALFNDRLEHGLAQAARHGWKLAVMFVDLDDFKQINDTHGHEVGDAVLRAIAGRLQETTRADDTVSRHGGDEFLYLLLEIKRDEDIAAIAAKLAKTIEAPCEVPVKGVVTRLIVKASIGVSVFPTDGTTAEELIASADEAMYLEKRRSRGLKG